MADIMMVVGNGRIIKDPETRWINGQNGQFAVTEFSIACQGKKTGQQNAQGYDEYEVSYFNLKAMGKLASEVIDKYYHKGDKIGFSGELTQERWQDKTTGENRSVVKIIVRKIQKHKSANTNQSQNTQQPQQQQNNTQQQNPPQNNDDGWQDIANNGSSDNVPF